MWKIIISITMFLYFKSFAVDNHEFQLSDKKDSLNKEFPYAILGQNYGILNKDDLLENEAISKPVPFRSKKSYPFQYWQCFEVKKTTFICERGIYDKSEKDFMSMFIITIRKDMFEQKYINNKLLNYRACLEFLKEWKDYTDKEKYVCISAEFLNEEKIKTNVIWNWIFHRFKTKKGCNSFSSHECI